jgi:pyridoxine 4-dehydrogenase
MQEQGKIRHIGLSEVTPAEIEAARKIVDIASVQNRYSLADRRNEETLRYCEQQGIAFLPWYPMAGGKQLKPDHPPRRNSVGLEPHMP